MDAGVRTVCWGVVLDLAVLAKCRLCRALGVRLLTLLSGGELAEMNKLADSAGLTFWV